MAEKNSPAVQSAHPPFVITRTVDAPRELVWKMFTEREHLMRWFGPKDFTMPACTLDLRPGGIFHYSMRSADGFEMWAKWTFREIVKPEKLVFVVSFSDAAGGMTRYAMNPNWPLETLSTTTFTEHEGKTTITIQWAAYNASAEEQQTFDDGHESMNMGWSGTFDRLEAYLADTL
jgi:uncharacterized protein YndB with AHSA1/START domain